MAMHQTTMNSLVLLFLIGAGLHLTSSAELADDTSGADPNFPEKQEISERRDPYMPFPIKNIPIIIYQSDNQPSVHVVQQQQTVAGLDAGANRYSSSSGNDGQSTHQSGSAVYLQSNGQQYQENASPNTYSTDQTLPNLQNHQFISIGLSAINDYLGNTVFPAGQHPANPTSQSQAPVQYLVQSNQQPVSSHQNSNSQVSSQTQQIIIPQYAQIQQGQGYLNQNQAPVQYVQNNQQQNVAYHQNSPQSPYNAVQHLGIAISTVQPLALGSQQQVVSTKVMGQNNIYQQNQQSQPQMESNEETESGESDPQYIRISVYPYGAIDPKQIPEPHQFYKIAIPKPNGEDDEEDEQNGGNANYMGVTNQGSRYRGSSSNARPQRPNNNFFQRQPNKMNTANMNQQTQKQTRQNSPKIQIPEESEYQQILIHIPHSIASPPKILVQPNNNNDQSSASYTPQGQKQRKPSPNNKQRKQPKQRNQPPRQRKQPRQRKRPQMSSSNKGYRVRDYIHPATGSISFNQRYIRPKPLPRFPPYHFPPVASNNYPRHLFRPPFRHNVGRFAGRPILPLRNPYPEIYASSNLHFKSLNPLFARRPMRNRHRRPFYQMSASMMRPQILPSPLMPLNMFHSSYEDQMMAQASFPRITRSRKDNLNRTGEDIRDHGFPNSDSSLGNDRIIKSLEAKSTEAFLKQIESDVRTHDSLDGVLGTSSARNPGIAGFNVPQSPDLLKFDYADAQVRDTPFRPMPHQSISTSQSQGGGKYGTFMKKLTALSNSLIHQSLGRKPMPFGEGIKRNHQSNEYSIEEIIDSVLPENASPRATTIMKTDRIGASIPKDEFSERVQNTEEKNANPPNVAYGLRLPAAVDGKEGTIEASKEVDPLEVSASELKETSRVADDVAETNVEKVFDYVDDIYSMLPNFIKHSIGQLSDDQLGSEWLSGNSTSAPKINPKKEASTDESKITSDVKSTNSGEESSSAFEKDIEELTKILHKEEKSDLI